LAMALILPFELAYEPFVYANIGSPEIGVVISRLLTYLATASALMSFCIVFVSRDLLSLIAPAGYFGAYLIIFLMLPAIAFRGVYYIGESLLYIKGKTHLTAVIVSLFTVGSMILNYLLIPLWGRYGAVLVVNLTVMSSAVVLLHLGMRTFPIPLERGRLGIVAILFVCLLSVVFLLSRTNRYIYYSFVPVSGYLAVFFFYRSGFFEDEEKSRIRRTVVKLLYLLTPGMWPEDRMVG